MKRILKAAMQSFDCTICLGMRLPVLAGQSLRPSAEEILSQLEGTEVPANAVQYYSFLLSTVWITYIN
jgi:hypothetical protein